MGNRKIRRVTALVMCLVLLFSVSVSAAQNKKWIAAGTAFGVKLKTDGVVVVGIPGEKGPSYEAGLRRGDIITKINGEKVTSVTDFPTVCEEADGRELVIEYTRGDKNRTAKVTPVKDQNEKYRLGIWIRDTAAGIGTVTVIDPETNLFIGLGHGICDAASGTVIPIASGSAEEVRLTGVEMGKTGEPGELRGSFTGRKIGKLLKNKETGIYGILTEIPDDLYEMQLELAKKSEVKEGKAHIISSVADGKPQKYEIRIEEIRGDTPTRNFTVHVTDKNLLRKTGGIVQGMSGSPILQNGKIVGAVTHVLVGDPTRGYGIFIENMIDAA